MNAVEVESKLKPLEGVDDPGLDDFIDDGQGLVGLGDFDPGGVGVFEVETVTARPVVELLTKR